MSYKHVLLGRHYAVQDTGEDPAPLRYIDSRNHDALRAWRKRYDESPVGRSPSERRSWLASLIGAHSEASFR